MSVIWQSVIWKSVIRLSVIWQSVIEPNLMLKKLPSKKFAKIVKLCTASFQFTIWPNDFWQIDIWPTITQSLWIGILIPLQAANSPFVKWLIAKGQNAK